MLTGIECVRMMEEKEKKKKEEAELKVQRQQEREKKRQENQKKQQGVAERRVQREERVRKKQEKEQAQNPLDCSRKCCGHPAARTWLSCNKCDKWLHCVCAGVRYSDAKNEDFEYTCNECS